MKTTLTDRAVKAARKLGTPWRSTRKRRLKLAAPWRPMSEAPRDGEPILIMQCDGSGVYICAYGEDGDWWSFSGLDKEGSIWEAMGTLSEAGYYGWLALPDKLIAQLGPKGLVAPSLPKDRNENDSD